MTTETKVEIIDEDNKRFADGISGGIFLLSLGVLLATGWWWLVIMVAIGLFSGAS